MAVGSPLASPAPQQRDSKLRRSFRRRRARERRATRELLKALPTEVDFWLSLVGFLIVFALTYLGRFNGSPGHLNGATVQQWNSVLSGLVFALSTTGLVFVAAMPGDRATQTLMLLSADSRSPHEMKVVSDDAGHLRVLKKIVDGEESWWTDASEDDVLAAKELRSSYADLLRLFQYVARVSLLSLISGLLVHWQYGTRSIFLHASFGQAISLAVWFGLLTYLALHVLSTLRALEGYGAIRRADVLTTLTNVSRR